MLSVELSEGSQPHVMLLELAQILCFVAATAFDKFFDDKFFF